LLFHDIDRDTRARDGEVRVEGSHPPAVSRQSLSDHDRVRQVVRLAVDYLRQLGLQHFAYCGLPGVKFSEDRSRHFTDWIRAMGNSPLVYEDHERHVPTSIAAAESTQLLRTQRLSRWLKSLPRPVGLMACSDACAQQIGSGQGAIGDDPLSLREISELTGFHQVEWLCKVFRRKTGQTPGEYREAMQPTKPLRPAGGIGADGD